MKTNGYAIVSINNKEGAINKNGEWVIPASYNYLSDYMCNTFKAQNSEGKYGCLNEQGAITVDFIFKNLEDIAAACNELETTEKTQLQQLIYKLNEANVCDVEINNVYENTPLIKLKKKSKIAYYNPFTNTFLWKENGF